MSDEQIMPGAEPFFFKGNHIGVLVCHGFHRHHAEHALPGRTIARRRLHGDRAAPEGPRHLARGDGAHQRGRLDRFGGRGVGRTAQDLFADLHDGSVDGRHLDLVHRGQPCRRDQGCDPDQRPTLVIQSREDHVVNPDNAARIVGGVGANRVELVWLENSYHVATIDHDKALIAQLAIAFIKSIAGL
jgi:pimeloyl-ACP methyl ester carboxylesterase